MQRAKLLKHDPSSATIEQWLKKLLLKAFDWEGFHPVNTQFYQGSHRYGFALYDVHGVRVEVLVGHTTTPRYTEWARLIKSNLVSYVEIVHRHFVLAAAVRIHTVPDRHVPDLIRFDDIEIAHIKTAGHMDGLRRKIAQALVSLE